MSGLRNAWRKTKLAGVSMLALALVLLPASFFDDGRSLCLFTALSGYRCYACGMTRALMHLIHLDVAAAWRYNPLSFVVLPLLLFVTGRWYVREVRWLLGCK